MTASPAAAARFVAGERCDLCGSPATRRFWCDELVECLSCRLVRAAPRFFQVEPAAVYDAAYYSGAEYVDYRGDRRAAHANARRRIKVLRKLAPGAQALFEIGCGYGYFLELAANHWSASGIEVSPHAAAEAQRAGARCSCGDYLSRPASGPVDLVCLWDTIEHLIAPRLVLEKIARELAPGGVLAISTGDIGAWLPRFQQQRWRLIHPPTHLWYFSLASLSALLRETGFALLLTVRPTFFRSLRLYVPRLAAHLPTSVGDLPVPMQTGDLIEIYARRSAP